ncbi:hypothetical protein BCR42DRAFT_413623 [Absidia repens]|uniref:F-box/LRR-repeat protein 15-like leucin rich repeat domain-containing protein n=1 Tax=Absidia repens TaxID=90262 RepID=A0A1X2IHU7_9FUNG|nr:hypothetical protein BCR42DRAFT_413623 [Absidia repens]
MTIKEESSLYSIISFLVVWTEYIVRTYIRIKAALDAVVYVAQSPAPRQRHQQQQRKPSISISTDSIHLIHSPSPSPTMDSYSTAPIHKIPNEILRLVILNGTKNDLLHYPILPPPSLLCPTDVDYTPHASPSPSYRRPHRSSSTTTTSSSTAACSLDSGHHVSSPPLPTIIRSFRLTKYGHAVQTLRLGRIPEQVTDDVLLYITRHCPNITVLDLSHCKRVTSSGYQHLARASCAPSLIHLNLSYGTRLTDAALVSLSMRCDSLETIHLTGCHRVTQTGVRSLVAASRQSLRFINIKDCIRVSGRLLQDLALLCGPRLIGVDATRICSILHSDIKALVHHCPRLEQLYVGQNKSQLVCQLQQRMRVEQQQEPWIMPFSSSSMNLRNRTKSEYQDDTQPPLSPSSSSSSSSTSTTLSPRPSSTSLSASLLQQRQLSRSKSSSLYTKPNALDSLLDMLRQHNIDPIGSTTTDQIELQQQQQQERPRSHRSRHLSQPVWKHSTSTNNSLGYHSTTDHRREQQPPQYKEADQHLKAVDFSHWTCLTDQLIRRLRQHRGHAIQYIGLEGCSIMAQHSSSTMISGL